MTERVSERSYYDDIELHFLEMPKFRRLYTPEQVPRTGLERMLMYFGNVGGAVMMQQLAKEDAAIERILKLEEGFPIDKIAKFTGISEDEIEALEG